jgi:hypothetical protein
MTTRTTMEACRELGITYDKVYTLLRSGKLDPPPRNGSGDFAWSAADVARLRKALAAPRRRRTARPIQEESPR